MLEYVPALQAVQRRGVDAPANASVLYSFKVLSRRQRSFEYEGRKNIFLRKPKTSPEPVQYVPARQLEHVADDDAPEVESEYRKSGFDMYSANTVPDE